MTEKRPPCSWWRRWAHRRNRRFDNAIMWPAIRRRAEAHYPDDAEAAVLAALKAWRIFITTPGQEHWLCPCAAEDDPVPLETD